MQRRNVGLRFANPTYAEYFHSLSSGVAQVLGVLRPGFAGGVLIKAARSMGGRMIKVAPPPETLPWVERPDGADCQSAIPGRSAASHWALIYSPPALARTASSTWPGVSTGA
jgi:hypothetical protein